MILRNLLDGAIVIAIVYLSKLVKDYGTTADALADAVRRLGQRVDSLAAEMRRGESR